MLQNQFAIGLKVAIRSYEDGDFEEILRILKMTRTDDNNHELKWVLRYISGINDKSKSVTHGIEILKTFGSNVDEQKEKYGEFNKKLRYFFNNRGIK